MPAMIVRDLAGQTWRVVDYADANLLHVWLGLRVKRKGGAWVPAKGARQVAVRKEGCETIAAA